MKRKDQPRILSARSFKFKGSWNLADLELLLLLLSLSGATKTVMAYPFDKEARSPESTDVVSPLGHAESFRIPRKSVGASKTDSFTKEWPIKGDENGVSPPESPGTSNGHSSAALQPPSALK